jgi:DNA-binding NarL/FixJ family response regulator
VWELIAIKGLTDKEIATELTMIAKQQNTANSPRFTEDGIGNIIRRLFNKLKVKSREQLVRLFFNPQSLVA